MMQILPNKRQKRQPKEKGRRREEKKKQYNGQKKKDNNDLQKTTQKHIFPVVTSTEPLETLGSIVSLLAATLYQDHLNLLDYFFCTKE
jgi:hypothetical protein